MKKKVIFLLVCFALLLAVLLIPWPKHYSQTFTAVKLDEHGVELGTAELTIRGRESISLLFGRELRTVVVSCPDSFSSPQKLKASDFQYDRLCEIYSTTVGVVDYRSNGDLFDAAENGGFSVESYSLSVGFSAKRDRWYIAYREDEGPSVYYLASAVGDDSDRLISFFGLKFK